MLRAPKKKGLVTETVILGKGKYRKKSMQTTSGIGATIGNAIMPGVGGMLGHAAETLFKTIVGRGDYADADNIAMPLPENNTIMGLQARPVTNEVAQMHWNGQATRIAHREYIGTVSMTAGFSVAQYSIEPTSTFMFPWLSKVATRFQKWKLLGCVFEYVPTSANSISGGTPAVGQVAMGINYNANGPLPTTLTNMLNNQGSVSARPFDALVCPVECDESLTPTAPLYVLREGGTTGDLRLNVLGRLVFATQGPTAYTNCGQLWITYDMQLIGAYIEPPLAARIGTLVISRDEDQKCPPTLPEVEVCSCETTVGTSGCSIHLPTPVASSFLPSVTLRCK